MELGRALKKGVRNNGQMKTTVTIKGREDAQIKFRKLVEFYRTRALWFLNPAQPVDVISSSSIGIDEQLARDLAGENIMFHQGCIGGAWPKIAGAGKGTNHA